MSHKKPTRVLKEYYDSWVEAKKMFDGVVRGKERKGYKAQQNVIIIEKNQITKKKKRDK